MRHRRLLLALTMFALATAGTARAQFEPLLWCDFEACPVDQPVPTRGPAYGEPVWHNDFMTAIVRDGVMATRCLVLQDADVNHTIGGAIRFDFIDNAVIQHDLLTIAMDLQFDQTEDYYLVVHDAADEHNDVTVQFLYLEFDDNGWIHVHGAGSTSAFYVAQYTAGTTHHLELLFDMDRHRCRVIWDGTAVVTGRDFGEQSVGIGSLWMGTQFDQDTAGAMAVDDIEVSLRPVGTESATWSAVKTLYR